MQQKTPPLYVGIDLGTTNSVAAVFDGSTMTPVRNSQGGTLTPSIVRIDARGNVLVGPRARRYLDTDPANTRSEFKRLMGTANLLEFPAAAVSKKPEELSAEVLKSLRNDIADQTGVLPERAVISVPALFELHQTAATSEAARQAGFERIELIQEPVASAIAAGWSQDSADGPWLVYDLGGGTFDVSLLDTREGLLRIVGHDGDNFLGGRDFDRLLVDLVLQKLTADGIHIDRANPEHALALRRLRFAAEEAKIELTRAKDAPIFLSGLQVGGDMIDVDVFVKRSEYEALIMPLIDRSLSICLRLLAANGLGDGGLDRLVLVGGPTVTPLLREKAQAVLKAGFGEGLDPMTLVAQGAALFAGTVGLDGRPAAGGGKSGQANGPKVWLQFPAMTSDLTPYVVGKLLDQANKINAIVFEREDGKWQSEPAQLGADGSFDLMMSLLPRQSTTFNTFGLLPDGGRVALQPSSFSISHGITLGEPPLARTIGVALANNRVLQYFERGAPLPIRRSFTLATAETVHPAGEGFALKVPIVQGEFSLAHLCRLVGTLEIPGSALKSVLPVGSEIELTLELDRGGQLRASGRVVSTNQVFDQVALLVTPQITVEEIEAALNKVQLRADDLSRNGAGGGEAMSAGNAKRLSELFLWREDLRRSAIAFRGGDLDAGEQVRRGLAEFEAVLTAIEEEKAWPELTKLLEDRYAWALSWVAAHGDDAERNALNKAYQNAKQAIAARQQREADRQIGLMESLGYAAARRRPNAWRQEFDYIAARTGESTDLRRATELVAKGNDAVRRSDDAELQKIVHELWRLAPIDSEEQDRGHGSGLMHR
ncbi:MAG TPA: Hsp70 family protein [Burkholderiaceae bacterium]